LLLYYITDRNQFHGTAPERRERLLQRITEAARCGVDLIQLREKDLTTRELESLARAAVNIVRSSGGATRVLINSHTDIALAAGADGVHLRSRDISPGEVRSVWRLAGRTASPTIAVSCHTEAEAIAAKNSGADFVLFGPVFEDKDRADVQSYGLRQLRSACQHGIPVLALGGVTVNNARTCIKTGATGVAGIRLFQQGDVAETVKRLRALS
jgi:thiamine-phosphate pyrophosphorylase